MPQLLEVEGVETKNHNTEQKIQQLVPYFEKQGHQLLLKMKTQLKRALPDDIKTTISSESTKLSTKFEGCKDDCVGETKSHIAERIKDHNSKERSSYLLKHACENGHTRVWEKHFQIFGKNYQLNFKQKLSESLFIWQLKPTLNVNEKSIALHLFNWFITVIIFREASFLHFNTEFGKLMDYLLWFH